MHHQLEQDKKVNTSKDFQIHILLRLRASEVGSLNK